MLLSNAVLMSKRENGVLQISYTYFFKKIKVLIMNFQNITVANISMAEFLCSIHCKILCSMLITGIVSQS